MKKYYIVRYDDDTTARARVNNLPDANAAAEALARANPGKVVCVFQVKSAMKVDVIPVVDVPTED